MKTRILAEFDALQTPPTLLRYTIDGPLYVDEHVLVHDAATGQERYYVLQELYTVAGLADAAGSLKEAYLYDAYGQVRMYDLSGGTPVLVSTSPEGNRYFFTGRELDAVPTAMGDRQFYHYRARAYDPRDGWFLQRDPAGYMPGVNLYEYVRSRPGTLVDPSGELDPITLIALGAGALILLAEPALAPGPYDDPAAALAGLEQERLSGLATLASMPVGGFGFKVASKLAWSAGTRLGAGWLTSSTTRIAVGALGETVGSNVTYSAVTGQWSNWDPQNLAIDAAGGLTMGWLLGPSQALPRPSRGEPACYRCKLYSNGKHVYARIEPIDSSVHPLRYEEQQTTLAEIEQYIEGRLDTRRGDTMGFGRNVSFLDVRTPTRVRNRPGYSLHATIELTYEQAEHVWATASRLKGPQAVYSTLAMPQGPCHNCVTSVLGVLNQAGVGDYGMLSGVLTPASIGHAGGGAFPFSPLGNDIARGVGGVLLPAMVIGEVEVFEIQE
jgi:RHS repeat-associated protein